MDEEAVPGPTASPDPGYHDDDELAAALAAQLDHVIETGSVPLQREGPPTPVPAVPAPSATSRPRADPPRAAEPPALTGPLKPPSHRADLATTATGPSTTVEPEHRPEHRADRQPNRGAHRSEALREAERAAAAGSASAAEAPAAASASAAAPAPAAPATAASRAAPPATGPVPGAATDTGSVPAATRTGAVPLDTAGLPLDTGSLPLSRRARRAAERASAVEQVGGATGNGPLTEPVDLPMAAARPATRRRGPAPADPAAGQGRRDRDALAHRGEDGDLPAEAPPARRRSFRAPPTPASEPAAPPAPESPAAVRYSPAESDAEPEAAPAEGADDVVDERSSGADDGWSRALRIVGGPVGDDDLDDAAGGPESSPGDAGSWFQEPLPTTGTIVISGSPTGPVPLAEPDDDGEVDEVESEYDALAADTASVGVLPPMVEEAGRHVVPAISRESLDRERLPEAVLDEPQRPALRSGLLAPLATAAGAAGSPLAIIVGFALGGGPATSLGLLVGVVLALPAALRLSAFGARSGRDAVSAARASLGETTGTAAGIVLLIGRIGIAALGLLGVAETATSFAGRTGLGGSLPASGAAILAVLLAGLLALAVGTWPGRIVGVVLGAAGAVALFASAALLVVLSGSATDSSGGAESPVPAAVAGFALVGLIVSSGAAEVTRRPLVGSPWRLGVVGTVLGAAAAAAVIALGGAAAGAPAGGGSATDGFVGAVIDVTSVALVGPIAVLLLLSSLALVATAARGAGTAAVSLLERGRSTALGTAAAALVAIALALAGLAVGLGASAALVTFGPLLAVPLTAVLAALTVAPATRRGAGRAPLVALGVTVLVGWLLVDHLLAPGERSPLLDLLGVPGSSHWRGVPAVGLLVAGIGGAVAGALAHVRPPAGQDDDATERLPAMQVASPE